MYTSFTHEHGDDQRWGLRQRGCVVTDCLPEVCIAPTPPTRPEGRPHHQTVIHLAPPTHVLYGATLFFIPRGGFRVQRICVHAYRLCCCIQWCVCWLFLKTHPANCPSVYNYISVHWPKINPLNQPPPPPNGADRISSRSNIAPVPIY